MKIVPKNSDVEQLPLDDCTWEPYHLDWQTARQLWAIHRDCAPVCLPQLAAGAVLSHRLEED